VSRNNPIPVRLRDNFVAHMDGAEIADLPDGAWFAVQEEAAQRFIDRHHLKFADANSAVHQWHRLKGATEVKP
jgi:hypothetical protein